LPPPTIDEVDKMYRHLVEIHTITTAQLVECIHWRWSNLTPNTAHANVGWRGPTVEPSAIRTAPLPPTDFSPQALLW
jgi:hypothetical protein